MTEEIHYRENVKSYLDPKFRINSHKHPTRERSENADLNMCKYIFGLEMAGEITYEDEELGWKMLKANSAHNVLSPDHKSHDNFTGMVALSEYLGFHVSELHKPHGKLYHPRSIFYWNYIIKDRLIDRWLLIFTCLANVWTCLFPYKYRNGKKINATDNELLMIMMYRGGLKNVWFCRIFGWICHILLRHRFTSNYFREMINLWYKHDEYHPVKQVWRRIDGDFKWWK